ncbi:MAG: hypothetical protein RRY23_00095 [Alistipes sp.]
MAYVTKSIGRPAGGAGNPTPKNPNVLLFDMEDVETYPTRTVGVTTAASGFKLKNGKKLFGVYLNPSTIEILQEPEGDADARGYKKGFKGEHPGNSVDSEDFVEFHSNKNLGAFVLNCNDHSARLIGDPCNPLSMKVETTESKDGTKKTITLQQDIRDEFRILRYTGELPEVIGATPDPAPESI